MVLPGKELRVSSEISQIINDGFTAMAYDYAKLYVMNPANFISCFKKFSAVKMSCAWIVNTFAKDGSLDDCRSCGKDFRDWAKRQGVGERWERVLADTMLIIYNIVN